MCSDFFNFAISYFYCDPENWACALCDIVLRRRSKQWPKRGEAAPVPTYETCVCAESVGFHDLGEGHWPQVVPSRECGFGISPISKLCRVLTEPEDGFVCKQRTYAVRVLRRRDGPVQQSAGHSRDMLPLELRDEWELVERHVNSSCELEAVIMWPQNGRRPPPPDAAARALVIWVEDSLAASFSRPHPPPLSVFVLKLMLHWLGAFFVQILLWSL